MRLSDEQMMDDVSAMIAEAFMAPPVKAKKRVRFSVVEELEFRVGYTSCAVPTAGGPPVGLIGAPIAKHVYEISNREEDIEAEDKIPRGDINDVWICPLERVRMLTNVYGFSVDDISLLCREARAVQDARAQSRMDFDTSYVLRSGNLSQLQLLNELRYTDSHSVPVQAPVKKVMLFESSDRIGILA